MIKIKEKIIDESSPTFIVAEIGANHNNNIELAKKTIMAAAAAGVDAVKFQTYTAEELLADYDRLWTHGEKGKEVTEKIGETFDKISLKREWHSELFGFAESLGLIAFSTPFSPKGVDFLNEELNVPCFKVASSDVGYIEMLKKLGETKKTVMISLGKCTIGEADIAIKTLEEAGCNQIVVMHCVAQYPSPMDEMNLKIIQTLKLMYPNYVIGFSDHSLGITAPIGAVVLGAKVIEKHFTIDKTLEGPDHWFSLDQKEMKNLVTEIRNIEMALGNSRKEIMPSEINERKTSVRSIVLNNPIQKGQAITSDDIKYTRPGWGISPYDYEKVIGLKPTRDLPNNTVLTWDCFK